MNEDHLYKIIVDELQLKFIQVRNAVEMLDSDNTVPFIARYRKERTGSLDEDQIRGIQERIKYLRAVEARRETILRSIKSQQKLTPELEEQIESTHKLQDLEDLYLPYRPKKKTRASMAKERDLEPLAQIILAQEITSGNILEICVRYVSPEKEINTPEEALAGAKDIIAEVIADTAEIKRKLRDFTQKTGWMFSESKGKPENREFEMYSDYKEPVNRIPPHRILAINRGENEGMLKSGFTVDLKQVLQILEDHTITNRQSIFYDSLIDIIKDSYSRLIEPAISREIHNQLTRKAESHAINVFAVNLRNLLMQPPVKKKHIIGIDPGYRTGCKVAVIDETGRYLAGNTIFPHPPQKEYFEAKSILRDMITRFQADLIAIGNGTASRETEMIVAELIKEIKSEREVAYLIVSEAGASVYSASEVAKEEFPELEASMRGNISIARRIQDPLSELVKIDPRSIGVGLYQHDINQKLLSEALDNVVESCVNHIGVDLNTASRSLLTHISGLNKRTAENIVSFRDKNGPFKSREDLKNVPGVGLTAFEQAAGFLRIPDGQNPLDATSIHPESYPATEKLLQNFKLSDPVKNGGKIKKLITEKGLTLEGLAEEIGCGQPTLVDILDDLEKPGRDPRDNMPKPIFRQDVLKMEDLKEGMILKGTIRNVVDFGAFVDIGVKQDGLIHISNMTTKYIKSPLDIVQVGDVLDVQVLSVDLERERIALSMKINAVDKN